MQMSQISFSNELYSGGDVLARGDQSSDDSVYENPDPSENVTTQRPEPARKSNVYTSILEPKSGKSALVQSKSKKSCQWRCTYLAVFMTFLTFILTFILATLGTLVFVEKTNINPISFLFSNSEKPNPNSTQTIEPTAPPTTTEPTAPPTTTEHTAPPTTTVKPIEWDPCVNEIGDEQSKFYIGNTQYFVKTNLNLGNSSWYAHNQHCINHRMNLIDNNDATDIVLSAEDKYWRRLISSDKKYWLSDTKSIAAKHCSMAIFKNNKIYKEVTKRFWTFFHNIDCQNKEQFYLDHTWMYDGYVKFASICKSNCQNTATESTTTLTRTTTLSTKTTN